MDLDVEDAHSFDLDTQKSIITHKVALGNIMPKGSYTWSDSPIAVFIVAPAEDADKPFHDLLEDICLTLNACVVRDRPTVVVHEQPASVAMFTSNVVAKERKTMSSSDVVRAKIMLCLFTAG